VISSINYVPSTIVIFSLSLTSPQTTTNNRDNLKKKKKELNSEVCPVEDKIDWCEYQPEYGAWMIEAIPSRPYGGSTVDLLDVEKNMKIRRDRLEEKLR
jgi:hypothetical protein